MEFIILYIDHTKKREGRIANCLVLIIGSRARAWKTLIRNRKIKVGRLTNEIVKQSYTHAHTHTHIYTHTIHAFVILQRLGPECELSDYRKKAGYISVC